MNTIIGRALLRTYSAEEMTGYPDMIVQQQRALVNVKTLTDAICASVPFFFGLVGDGRQEILVPAKAVKAAVESTTASTALLLVWPLTIASAAMGVPPSQKRWIKTKVALIGRIVGSGVLDATAKVNLPSERLRNLLIHICRWTISCQHCHWRSWIGTKLLTLGHHGILAVL